MRTKPEYWLPDHVFHREDETIAHELPTMSVRLSEHATENGWVTTVIIKTGDVTRPGQVAEFAQTERSETCLTPEQKLSLVMSMLEHEVREQLGLNPHKDGDK